MSRVTRAREDWQDAYITGIEGHGRVIRAAQDVGVAVRTVQRERDRNDEFAKRETAALKVCRDMAIDEVKRRAIEGVSRTFYNAAGQMTRQEVEYSDACLFRFLEYLETGSFRQKQQIEHSAPGVFATRAERKAALAAARAEIAATSGRPLSPPSENEPAAEAATETEPKK